MEIASVRNLKFTYPESEKRVLDGVNFGVERGEFVLLCGATGCGKSTLLRMFRKELEPFGEKTGEVYLMGRPAEEYSDRETVSLTGFVMQNPEHQTVTDKVWHELSFGLENTGVPSGEMHRRIAEISGYFGIGGIYGKSTAELSGGQKQILALASAIAMRPKLIILDEPTSQLDPVSAGNFLASLKKLNEDFGITVIMTEHRIEEAVKICSKLMFMENGKISAYGSPKEVMEKMRGNALFMHMMPAGARIFTALESHGLPPLSLSEGRKYIEDSFRNDIKTIEREDIKRGSPVLELKGVCFRYSKNSPDVLKSLDLTAYSGEVLCILGENGSGKSTMLSVIAGLKKAYSGKIKVMGKSIKDYKNGTLYKNCLALLPQDVQTVFLYDTVREELRNTDTESFPFDLSPLMSMHPYDLSGGQQQITALAKVLGNNPKAVLLDEPTKGVDAEGKAVIGGILRSLKEKGITVIAVTHDIEFSAEFADRCVMFFNGRAVSDDRPDRFFSANAFYTTAVSRMTRDYFENAVTVSDAVRLCSANGRKNG